MLAQHAEKERGLPVSKRARRFLLVEGLYANGGGIWGLLSPPLSSAGLPAGGSIS